MTSRILAEPIFSYTLGVTLRSEVKEVQTRRAAQVIKRHIQMMIDRGGSPQKRLSAFTVAKRLGDDNALKETGTLRSAIEIRRTAKGSYQVGYPPGNPRINQAYMNEFGFKIKMKPGMYAFMRRVKPMVRGRKSAHPGWLLIPPRPFIRPGFTSAMNELQYTVPKAIRERLESQLKVVQRKPVILETSTK